jgi:hypothetical protein
LYIKDAKTHCIIDLLNISNQNCAICFYVQILDYLGTTILCKLGLHLSFSLLNPTLCLINNHVFMFSFSWAKTISRQPPTTSPTQLYRENGASECWSPRRSSRQQGSQQSKLEQENPMYPCLARRMRAFSPLDRPKWSLTTRDVIHQIVGRILAGFQYYFFPEFKGTLHFHFFACWFKRDELLCLLSKSTFYLSF